MVLAELALRVPARRPGKLFGGLRALVLAYAVGQARQAGYLYGARLPGSRLGDLRL